MYKVCEVLGVCEGYMRCWVCVCVVYEVLGVCVVYEVLGMCVVYEVLGVCVCGI